MPRPHAQLVCPQVTGQQQCVLGTALFVVVAAADYQGFSPTEESHIAGIRRRMLAHGERRTFLVRRPIFQPPDGL
jgi:hypothetical protein